MRRSATIETPWSPSTGQAVTSARTSILRVCLGARSGRSGRSARRCRAYSPSAGSRSDSSPRWLRSTRVTSRASYGGRSTRPPVATSPRELRAPSASRRSTSPSTGRRSCSSTFARTPRCATGCFEGSRADASVGLGRQSGLHGTSPRLDLHDRARLSTHPGDASGAAEGSAFNRRQGSVSNRRHVDQEDLETSRQPPDQSAVSRGPAKVPPRPGQPRRVCGRGSCRSSPSACSMRAAVRNAGWNHE